MENKFEEISSMLDGIKGGTSDTGLFDGITNSDSDDSCYDVCINSCPKNKVGTVLGQKRGIKFPDPILPTT